MKRNIVIAGVAAAALIAGGTATAVALTGDSGTAASPSASSAQPGTSSVRVQDDDAHEDLVEARAAKVLAPDAAAAALKSVPGTVTGIDLDEDDPGLVWDVDVLGKDGKWHEITVDAGNAKVLGTRTGHDDHGQDRARAELKGTQVDAARAARTAATSYGTVTSVDLDDDHRSTAVWEVESVTKDGKEHKLNVDLNSAKVSAVPASDRDDNDNDGYDD